MNTPRPHPWPTAAARARARRIGAVPIRSSSFVSMLVDARAVRHFGLPVADYFIWNDDFEYSARLLRRGTGLYVPSSVVEHWTKAFGATDADPGDRFYYEVRNKVWMLTRSRALGPAERLVYLGATGRRWARTIAHSDNKARLVRVGTKGLLDGVVRAPQPNEVVLRDTLPAIEPAAGETPPFSVLLPVYHKDDPQFLRRSFASVTDEQTLAPNEVVIVQDGPLGPELTATLDELAAGTSIPVIRVDLPENVGLARALTEGLARCAHEVVARQDADDISRPDRFARQLPLIAAGCDIVGSAIQEFEDESDTDGRVRTPPLTQRHIEDYARFHDPFNHPSVVYRRAAVEKAGGYRDLALMEDYWLFARMLADGVRAANLPEPLVRYRIGAGAYARRGGRTLFTSELELQRSLRDIDFLTGPQYLRNVALRASYRLVGERTRRLAYRTLVIGRAEKGKDAR